MSFTPRTFVRHLRAWFGSRSPQSDDSMVQPSIAPALAAGRPRAFDSFATSRSAPELAFPVADRAQSLLSRDGATALTPEGAALGLASGSGAASRAGRSTLKIVVAGDGNVGKTSLIRRYAKHKFSEVRNQTLGIDITTQEFTIGGRSLALVLWDIEGQRGERPFFYHGANAALLVYDVTTPGSLEALKVWAERIRRYAPPDIPILIAGNKVDLPVAVPASQGQALAAQIGARDHLLLSARTEQNVAHTFNQLAELASAELALR